MMKPPKVTLISPDQDHQLSASGGINNTEPEQQTAPNELASGQNLFSDLLGGYYNRLGSLTMGGQVSGTPGSGIFQYVTKTLHQELIIIIGTQIMRFDGTRPVVVSGAPAVTAGTRFDGVYFPDTDQYVITNGVDYPVVFTVSGGTMTAASVTTLPKGHCVGYNLFGAGGGCLVFGNVTGSENVLYHCNPGLLTYSSLSTSVVHGQVLGIKPLDYSDRIVVTNLRAYRLSGIIQTTDANTGGKVYQPASLFDIGASRCIAPRTILQVYNQVFWIGLDELNNVEWYRTDGQLVQTLAGRKIKLYQQFFNQADVANACAVQYGPYYKVAIAPGGSQYNTNEILLDTKRSIFFENPYNGAPSNPVFEPVHVLPYGTSQYALYNSSGQDFVVALDQQAGILHRQGVGYGDEATSVDTTASPVGTVTVGHGQYAAQPVVASADIGILTLSVLLDASGVPDSSKSDILTWGYSSGNATDIVTMGYAANPSDTISVSLETDLLGVPSGVLVDPSAVTTLIVPSTTALTSGTFPGSFTIASGTRFHIVFRTTGTSLSVISRSAPGGFPDSYLSYSGGSWTSGAGNLCLSFTEYVPIEFFGTHTTSLGIINHMKKTTQVLVAAQSSTGATVQMGIGVDGRDSDFYQKPVVLSGGSNTWAATDTDPSPPNLSWAFDEDTATQGQRWASITTSYTQTVFAPNFVPNSFYLSYRFYFKGFADVRINAIVPLVDILPATQRNSWPSFLIPVTTPPTSPSLPPVPTPTESGYTATYETTYK